MWPETRGDRTPDGSGRDTADVRVSQNARRSLLDPHSRNADRRRNIARTADPRHRRGCGCSPERALRSTGGSAQNAPGLNETHLEPAICQQWSNRPPHGRLSLAWRCERALIREARASWAGSVGLAGCGRVARPGREAATTRWATAPWVNVVEHPVGADVWRLARAGSRRS